MATTPDTVKPTESAKPREEHSAMKSTLKVALPIVILLAVIFGITFFSQYTTRDPVISEQKLTAPPLEFTSSDRYWIPHVVRVKIDEELLKGNPDVHSYKIQNVFFPGFYEPDSHGQASFWFENKNASSVTMQLKAVSYTSCSEGAVYVIPPDTTRLTLQMSGLSVLPQGLVSGLPVGMVGPGALFDQHHLPPAAKHQFADPSKVIFNIPGANNPDGWTPAWGILELGFNAKNVSEGRVLTARFESVVDANPDQVGNDELKVRFDVVEPMHMFPQTIDFGVLDESSKPEPREIIVYSCTREPGRLAPPTVLSRNPLGGDPGKFLTVGTPVPVPRTDLEELSLSISDKLKKAQNITAAYRVPLTLNLKLGNERLDIGLLERTIDASAAGVDVPTKPVHVRAVIRGGVWLPEGNTYDLGSFKARDGVTRNTFELVTDNPDVVVKVADGQQQPEFVQVTMERQANLGGKGLYKVRVHIPPSKQVGLITYGVIVFEIAGPNPQRVRVPLKGRGDL